MKIKRDRVQQRQASRMREREIRKEDRKRYKCTQRGKEKTERDEVQIERKEKV